MIQKIQDLYTPEYGIYHMLDDLKARVESERAALREAVEEIEGQRLCASQMGQAAAGGFRQALDIIAEKTGVRHGE
jgi:hypothetical protein